MEFIWNMSEKNWKNLIADNKKKGQKKPRFSKDANTYGQCKIGNLSAEFVHSLDEDWLVYTNLFILGVDSGYGYTESGVPYSLANDSPAVPIRAKSFKAFKKRFETAFLKCIKENNLNAYLQPPYYEQS